MTYSFPPRNWIADGAITRLATDDEFGAYLYIAERRESEPFTEDTRAILDAWKATNQHVVNAVPPSLLAQPGIQLGDETEV